MGIYDELEEAESVVKVNFDQEKLRQKFSYSSSHWCNQVKLTEK